MQEKRKSNLTILIADDEKASREGLAELIESWGYKAKTAKDGLDALDKVKLDRPDILICDLKMPNLDGLGVLKSINNMPQKPFFIMLRFFRQLVNQRQPLGKTCAGWLKIYALRKLKTKNAGQEPGFLWLE